MVKRAKAKATAIEVDGRTYHPEFPPSEQNDVEKITKRFKNMTPAQAAAVDITEEELRNFAKVYRRLYQVARTNQDRLKAWEEGHKDEITDWDVSDFFKSMEDDERDGSGPVDAGPPKEAMDEWNRLREAEAAEAADRKPRGRQQRRRSGADDDEGNERHSEDDAESERKGKGDDSKKHSTAAAKQEHAPSSAAGPTLRSRFTVGDKDPMKELEAMLRSIQEVAADLTHLSNAADERDHYKRPLSGLAKQLDTSVECAQQAKEAIVKRLHEQSSLFNDSLCLPGSVRKRGRQGLEETSKEEQIRAKRGQAVASLARSKANPNAASQLPPLLQEPGLASPYYHGPYQGHGSNVYTAAAFQPSQQFQWSPPTAATADHSHAGRHHQNSGYDTPSRPQSQRHSLDAGNWSRTSGRTPSQDRMPDQHRTAANNPGGTPLAHSGFAAPSHPRHSLPAVHVPSATRNQPAAGFLSSPLAHQAHDSSYHCRPNLERREDFAAPVAAPKQNSDDPNNNGYSNGYEAAHAEWRERDVGRKESEEDVKNGQGSQD